MIVEFIVQVMRARRASDQLESPMKCLLTHAANDAIHTREHCRARNSLVHKLREQVRSVAPRHDQLAQCRLRQTQPARAQCNCATGKSRNDLLEAKQLVGPRPCDKHA